MLSYLPEEQSDAEEVAQLVTDAGRRCVLAPGDIADETFARAWSPRPWRSSAGSTLVANIAGRQQYVEDSPT